MADQDWNGLPYGHFGNASYQIDEQTWQFERLPALPRTLEPIGDPKLAIPASKLYGLLGVANQHTEPPSVRHRKETTDLVKSVPSLQPAVALLGPLLHASEAVESTTERHDPFRGSLLSYGRVFDASTRRSTQVAAFAYGPTGSDLRVVQVQLQKQGWDDSRDVWLEMPVISGEETTWKSEGSPIQQVVFAQPLESGENLLAVRTNSRVSIFKPVLRKAGPNRLQLKLLFEVSTVQNHGIPYADVSFNPWFPRQFAVIDQAAQWRIWEFRSRESSQASCVHTAVVDEDSASKSDLNDGWVRLTWICIPSAILVATRRSVTLHDITTTPSKMQDIDVNVSDLSHWVLDVSSVPSDSEHALVLTTTHMHMISVVARDGRLQARSEMRIRHFKSPEDITLRLTLSRDEEALMVILRSFLSSTLMSYRFSLDNNRVTLYDPIQFELKGYGSESANMADVLGFHFQSVAVAEKRSTDVTNTLLGRLRENECRFTILTIIKNDLSLTSLLYLDHACGQSIPALPYPTWRGKLFVTSSKIKDDFVVDDNPVIMDDQELSTEPVASYIRQRKQRADRLLGQEWTLNYEHVAAKVEQRATRTKDVDDVLAETQNTIIQAAEPDTIPMKTLLEISNGELIMNDMDRVATQIEQLATITPPSTAQLPNEADDNDRSTRTVVRAIEPASLLALEMGDVSAGHVEHTYGAIVSHWITPLHNKVPGRTRLAKAQLARRLAAELTLASHVLQLEDIEEQPENQQDSKPVPQTQSWDLPMHLASSQLHSQSQPQSILPTPSPTNTPSVTTASSRTTAFASAEISHLSKYTTFTKPTPSALPRSLSKLLSHWTPDADPEIYDWIATSRSISQRAREEEADSQLTEKQRARAHRKAERHIRRQRKEAQISQQQMLASSQMPELVVSASQPQAQWAAVNRPAATSQGPVGGMLNSSQQLGPGAASQAVPGRFGGRPPVKKKRKQGF